MITWLYSLDVGIFHFINSSLSNPFFDWLMPLLSQTPGFVPIVVTVLLLMIFKGGVRGRICAILLILGVLVGDTLLSNSLKNLVARPRPFLVILDAHVLVGRGGSGSFPSSHALNWFCATVITNVFYRRSLRFMLPLALAVSYSRVYNGVHYPSDVLSGIVFGAGTGAALVWTANTLWCWLGRRWFPLWWERSPSLFALGNTPKSEIRNQKSEIDSHWLRLGYLLIAALLLIRLAYLAFGAIELSEDEAYQWHWSKHLALSYYSKPPLIAYTQWLGTHLWGDNEFGIRFFSPVLAAGMSLLLLRFLAREVSARLGFIMLLVTNVVPLMAVGSIVMTVDPLSVFFWTAAMLTGWRAAQPEGTTRQWLWTGLWMGLGLYAKYTNLFQWISWAIFFWVWPPARRHLRRPGPWLAWLISAAFLLPVIVWNAQHHWITVNHVASDGGMNQPWHFTLRYTQDFLLGEFGLLHPLFFVGTMAALIGFWRKSRVEQASGLSVPASRRNAPATMVEENSNERACNPRPTSPVSGATPETTGGTPVPPRPIQDVSTLLTYLLCMGLPLFLFYFAWSFHSRLEFNWIALSIIPLLCFMGIYWYQRWDVWGRRIKPWFCGGIAVGLFAVVVTFNPDLLGKMLHRTLPAKLDLLHRVHGWKELAKTVEGARAQLASEGRPAFLIGAHYGFTSQVSFYLPEAKHAVQQGAQPLVYFYATDTPLNQYFFWPNYLDRRGQNAIFFREISMPPLKPGWLSKWLNTGENIYDRDKKYPGNSPPPEITRQFESVTDLGVREIDFTGNRLVRRVQLFACRNLKATQSE